jgi:hypothetical protein
VIATQLSGYGSVYYSLHWSAVMLKKILIMLFILLITACSAKNEYKILSNDTSADQKFLPVYKKEVLIAVGYANISTQNSDNISQRRLMAMRASKLDAYRNLIEQVYGQNINSTTTVEDMVVSSDTLRAHVEGLIYGAHLVSITPVGDDSYETKLELASTIVNDLRSMLNNS